MKLFPFQEQAVQQLLPHRSVLNGDDMGLGKTVQAIALDVRRRKEHNCDFTAQTLIVTMTSVMGSWEEHYSKWAPHLKVVVINRKNRQTFLDALKARSSSGLPEYQIFVCHWGVLRFIRDELTTVDWFHIIGDEIQSIKNRKAQQSQAFKKLRSYYKTGLSGTWADNRPDDAWSPLNWLWPRHFTSYWGFFNHHVLQKKHNEGTCDAEGCDGYHKRAFTEVVGVHDAESIHSFMGSAYVRRKKEEVLKDLPDKIYEHRLVDLHPLQQKAYDQMRTDMLAWVGKNENEPVPAPVVIAQLIRLQQFTCAYGKLEARKQFFGRHPETNEKIYHDRAVLVLDEPSSKLDALMEIIEGTNAQVAVFGQSKQVINLLAKRLQAAGITHGILTGDTPQADRDVAIQEFQSGTRRVFACTIKAGGVGITLTAASVAVFLDLAWSPSANRQAEDRLHRMGQKNSVLVIRLVARRTIDQKRNERIEMKWEWLKAFLDPA